MISDDKLEGDLVIPSNAQSIILFAHGSGSSRYSTRNQYVAQCLNDAGFATLLVDLLAAEEKKIDENTRHLRFDIDLLAKRFVAVTEWILESTETSKLKIGYFGSSTGAAAALIASTRFEEAVRAIVCRGGRPDLAETGGTLERVGAPTLLIVGSKDVPVIALNKSACDKLVRAQARELAVVPGAGHLFEEQGKMEDVARIAARWFEFYLLNKGGKFENEYGLKPAGLFSSLKNKFQIQMRLRDRTSAGEMLASLLGKYRNQDVMVIGIPRGGVVVAAEVAIKLDAELDVIIPRKLRAPNNSENSVGAVMQDGSQYIDSRLVDAMKISAEYLQTEMLVQSKEINRRMDLYRPHNKKYEIQEKVVILVDDGAATGATLIAGAKWIRMQKPRLLVIGIPIAPRSVADLLEKHADHVEVIINPPDSKFEAIEQFYEDFDQVSDAQVLQAMERSRRRTASDGIIE